MDSVDVLYRDYLRLRDRTDELCSRLFSRYRDWISCSPGCCACCSELFLLPVELYALRRQFTEHAAVMPRRRSVGACPFLHNRRCSIYPYRPLMCRVHGLPVQFTVEQPQDRDIPERVITWCDMNFPGLDWEKTDENNCIRIAGGDEPFIDMGALNGELEELNTRYRKTDSFLESFSSEAGEASPVSYGRYSILSLL